MTVVVTMEWFIYLYWILEWYVHTLALELKVKSYYEYCEQKAVQAKEDCKSLEPVAFQSFYEPTMSNVVPIMVSTPELDTAALGLFEELTMDLNATSRPKEKEVLEVLGTVDEDIDSYIVINMSEEDYEHDFYYMDDEDAQVQDEDCISLDDLMKEEVTVSPTGYEQYASAKIADNLDGPQEWVVTIVGMEESYIHVSDGKRLWVNVGEDAANLHKNDVLKLEVVRNGKEVNVENLFLLETGTSSDYLIPDEHFSHHYAQDYAVAI